MSDTTYAPTPEWVARRERLTYPTGNLIDGRWQAGPDRLVVTSPIDGQPVVEVAAGNAATIDAAVSAARAAFEDGRWSKLAPMQRKEILIRWADLCHERREDLALLHAMEMGKPAREARDVDMRAVVRTIRWFGEAIDKILDEIPNVASDVVALIQREPAGVVGAVVPWNFPLTMAAWKLAPALAAGCTVVLKPAEQSPLSALLLAELAQEAGIPDGVLNVVNGLGHIAGRALGEHPDVDVVTFTGSTAVGRKFLEYSAQSNIKRVWLELGGKGANVIFSDADLDKAANTAAWSIFYNAGQMCTAGSRLLVHESVHDEVVAKVMAIAASMQPANPLAEDAPLGAVVSAEHLGNVHRMLEAGIRESGELLVGGQPVLTESGGSYYPPTVVDGVRPDSLLAQQELFGPVLAITTFSDEREALELANGTQYGLASAVWTNDLSRAHRFSRALRMGVVWVNCYEEGDLTVPFGGVKQSGFGRDKSLHALDKFLDIKTTWMELT
jgi:gamma-glutamyl-gamma-aminobutyraldehyde dehydrogenase